MKSIELFTYKIPDFSLEQLFITGLIIALNIFTRYHQTVKLKEIAFHPSGTSLSLQIPISSCVQQTEQVQSLVFHAQRGTEKYKVLPSSTRK